MIPVIVVLVVLAGLFVFAVCPATRRHAERRELQGRYIAHRGLHGLQAGTPENSLAAYRAAIEKGLAIEIDIHITTDGELVVFHDNTLTRMCGAEVRVEAATLEQLKQYRLSDSDERIPTLQECLDTVAGQVPLLIEFKCEDSVSCRRLCEAADAVLSRYTGKYWIQSFNPLVLQWYRRHRPAICRGQLATLHAKKGLLYDLLGQLLLNFLGRPDFVSYDQAHSRCFGLRVSVLLGAFPVGWTFRSQEAVDRHRGFFRTYIFENFIP
ncbi:MAG: glycerophosphodiester phosphodiesterase [Clostridia bacterium]|nr:glycerophosphodiester phosphodiesterase [Clostridia bacterium]